MNLVLEAGTSVYETQSGHVLQDSDDKDGVTLTTRYTAETYHFMHHDCEAFSLNPFPCFFAAAEMWSPQDLHEFGRMAWEWGHDVRLFR